MKHRGAEVSNGILERIKNEPAMFVSLVGALLGLGASFGLTLDDTQTAAIMGFVMLLVGFVIRQQVTPTRRVAAEGDRADDLYAGPAADVEIAIGDPVEVLAEGGVLPPGHPKA